MLKTCARIGSALAIASLSLAPAMAKDTRSAASLPSRSHAGSMPGFHPSFSGPFSGRGHDRWDDDFFDFAGDVCDAPGNGKKTGHYIGNGRGHEFGRGKGHACDGQSPG